MKNLENWFVKKLENENGYENGNENLKGSEKIHKCKNHFRNLQM